MAKKGFNCVQIRTMIGQMGRKGMPQDMRAAFFETGHRGQSDVHQVIDPFRVQSLPFICQKQWSTGSPRKCTGTFGKILAGQIGQPTTYRDNPHFVAFADHAEFHAPKVCMFEGEANKLCTAHTRLVQKLQDKGIAQFCKSCCVRCMSCQHL
ncbi:MAG: hypothetical protein RL181_1455 [Bacteroidota bacterium]